MTRRARESGWGGVPVHLSSAKACGAQRPPGRQTRWSELARVLVCLVAGLADNAVSRKLGEQRVKNKQMEHLRDTFGTPWERLIRKLRASPWEVFSRVAP